jgi:hypothetical protein
MSINDINDTNTLAFSEKIPFVIIMMNPKTNTNRLMTNQNLRNCIYIYNHSFSIICGLCRKCRKCGAEFYADTEYDHLCDECLAETSYKWSSSDAGDGNSDW